MEREGRRGAVPEVAQVGGLALLPGHDRMPLAIAGQIAQQSDGDQDENRDGDRDLAVARTNDAPSTPTSQPRPRSQQI